MTDYEIDPATGLPALPEGFRWFVAPIARLRKVYMPRDANAWFEMRIEEMIPAVTATRTERRVFKKDRTVEYEIVSEYWILVSVLPIYEEEILYPEVLLNVATQMMDRVESILQKKIRLRDAEKINEKMLGAYPPKSINLKG